MQEIDKCFYSKTEARKLPFMSMICAGHSSKIIYTRQSTDTAV